MPSGGSNRKSTRQHNRDGTFRPDRHAGDVAKADGVPIKPPDLTGRAGELWDSLEPQLVQWGAGEIDSIMLADMCRWWAESRSLHEAGDVRKALAAYRAFASIASKYGLTIADRERLDLTVGESADDRESKFYGVVS